MPVTLVKEDGTGLANANSYASAADGDAYHGKHLYASAWTAATTGNKEIALMMATRLLDACYQWNGFRRNNSQALQWPREACADPDRRNVRFVALDTVIGPFVENNVVPQVVIDAACELARLLLVADRTAEWDGQGYKQLVVVGALQITFDPSTAAQILPPLLRASLSKFGVLLFPGKGTAKLVRV
jgi:hypothetical protein